MKKFKWCVIGAGGIADRRTIPGILGDKKSQLVAVMDIAAPVVEKLGAKYGVPAFTDEKKMLESVDCDAVYIGTPVFAHCEQARAALDAGKAVFTEKPIGLDSKSAAALVSAFKKKRQHLGVGYMMKYHNLHEKARSLVAAKTIGKVVDVRAQFTCWYPDIEGAWRQTRRLGGGGALMDLGVHCIELIEHVLDEEIVDVSGFYSTQSFRYEVEDSAIVMFRTVSGTLGHVDVNFNVPDRASEAKFELYGTEGYIICDGTLAQEETGTLRVLRSPQGDYEAGQKRVFSRPKLYSGAHGNLYTKQIVAFRKTVQSGIPDYTFADRAVRVQKIVDAVYRQKKH